MNRNSDDIYDRFHRETKPLKELPSGGDFAFSLTIPFFERYIRSGSRVADIGCGAGPYCLYFASRGAVMAGIDISERAIAANRRAAADLGISSVSFHVGDIMRWETTDLFDVVIASEVLEHLPDDAVAVQRVAKLLRPGGHFLISVPLEQAPLHRLRLRLWNHDPFDREVGHVRRYSGDDLLRLLRREGFQILEFQWTEGLLRNAMFLTRGGRMFRRLVRRPIVPLIKGLDHMVMRVLGPSQILVAAQRS